MEMNNGFVEKDPSIGSRTATEKGFKVDANGVPLDIIAKQRENEKAKNANGGDDITNDPMFAEMFGQAGVAQKDPFSKGGNEDHWISGSPAPIPQKKEEPKKSVKEQEEIPLEQQMIPTNDPNDISNDPKLKEMLNSMGDKNESESSDSHTIN